ncbi:COG2426 family protein [Archaeoglobus neptunius]|uniref:COG2426 family protein n=1 Tax=Archaeoglobus neptunius TaxID=2798580 RepID=UPI002ED96A62
MNSVLNVLLVSALPISEIRGGLPLALYYGFDPFEAYLLALAGNFLPIPFLLMFLDYMIRVATRIGFLDAFYRKIVERVERKKAIVEKYGYIGLVMFVAMPLPVTGAWTGVLMAFLLRLNRVRALVSIFAGICIAGLIVLLASLGVISIGSFIK